jgi:hypothetical protein
MIANTDGTAKTITQGTLDGGMVLVGDGQVAYLWDEGREQG